MFLDKNNNLVTYQQLKENFPTHNDIPFFLDELGYKKLAFDISLYLHNESIKIKNIQSSNLKLKSTRKRVENYKSGRLKTIKKIHSTLTGFTQELNTQQVPQSNFNPYLELFFKDWLWDQDDNLSYLNDINTNCNDILFLGCGAARVAYEYAKNNDKIDVYATDINPINLCLINNQKNTKLFDSVKNPTSIENSAVKFEFSSPDKLNNFFPFVADFYQMKTNQYEHVVSNWFLDILPNQLETNLSHLLQFIKEDGQFTYIGLSNFYNRSLEESFATEEIEELLKEHFLNVEIKQRDFNYLSTPYTSQKRTEKILIANCSKPKKEKTTPFSEKSLSLNYNQKLSIRKMEYITYARFLNHINETTSYEKTCEILQKEFGFSAEESQHYAKVMINKLNS